MRKIISVLITSTALFFFGVTSSMADWTIGLSATHGEYTADGEENENGEIAKTSGATAISYPTIFIEHAFDNGMAVGLDVIPASVESEEATRTDYNVSTAGESGNDGGTAGLTNKAKVGLSQHVTLYGIVPIMDTGAYVRAGVQSVNVETKEDLATGSQYGDIRIFGGTVGLGYQLDVSGGWFRLEVGYSEYEDFSLTSTNADNKVTADLEGEFGKLSIGRSF